MKALHHVGITVEDLDASIRFYHDVLGLQFANEPSPWLDGELPFKLPALLNAGPASMNGLTNGNWNRYFNSIGNSHVTTGAGDTFAAAFLAEYVRSEDVSRSLARGAVEAAETVQRVGAF